MDSTKHNKFTKTFSQFYFQPPSSRGLLCIREPRFVNQSRTFRIKNALQITQSFISRKQQSLSNYQKLSQVIEAQEKVFRSSSSFLNPQKAQLSDSNKKLNTLLKSHILSREFQERKKIQMFETQKDQKTKTDQFLSNYRYFGTGKRKQSGRGPEQIMRGSLKLQKR